MSSDERDCDCITGTNTIKTSGLKSGDYELLKKYYCNVRKYAVITGMSYGDEIENNYFQNQGSELQFIKKYKMESRTHVFLPNKSLFVFFLSPSPPEGDV